MKRIRPPAQRAVIALGLAWLAATAAGAQEARQEGAAPRLGQGQGPAGLPSGVTREQMWWAPTAEDWKKPVLITFQRTWEDALAVARETNRAILVCVNMDGEIASEHYAGVRYRQPEIAVLYEPYVCVIASVYRHDPRDFDEEGRRILCPRFGSVTCGEHIAIEPILYEKFMDGQRIAPRHIMVELDGSETYDVFYAWDTDSVFAAVRDGMTQRAIEPRNIVRGDRPLVERVASRDIQDRTAVETAYQNGDRDLRSALLAAAAEHPDAEPVDLLRLGVFGMDTELNRLARRALAGSRSEEAVALINESLRVPMEATERQTLTAALERLGESSPRARMLAVVHGGSSARAGAVDVDGWSRALAGGAAYAPAGLAADPPLEQLEDRAEQAEARPLDANARLELAESLLGLAIDPETSQFRASDRRTGFAYVRLKLEDARRSALEAEQLGATGWRVQAAIALSAYYLGNREEAYARAEAAVKGMPPEPEGWNTMAVLALFAEARWQAIRRALLAKEPWPSQWFTDVHAAYTVLARHPLGTDSQVAMHHDILTWLGASAQAAQVLDQGLERFPESWDLHERLRARVLKERGADGLETLYAEKLGAPGAPANLEWFAGYAALVAAESHRRAGELERALAAYDRAIAHYERGVQKNPETRASADHYVALALAGRARIAYERGDPERALAELISSLERKPEAAATLDGLNISPADTARMLRARLTELERDDLAARLEAALGKLDPELLELPAYERGGPPPGDGRAGRRRRESSG